MAVRIEFIPIQGGLESDAVAFPIWDNIPRVGETVCIRDKGPYRKFKVVGVEYFCDANREEAVPQVAVYIVGGEVV